MRQVKRVEIVIDKPHEAQVRAILQRVGVPGLTVFEVASGYGDRGSREGGELSDAMVNRYMLTTCSEAQLAVLVREIEPMLRQHGGLCLISDAQMIRGD